MGLPKWTLKKLFVLVEACVYLEKSSSCRLMKFWIGTSGFQYAEWKGNFYPEDLPAAKMLPFYAERLSTTEINYTFHRIPAPKTIDNWKALTPTNFQFALKAPQKITHWSKLRECADTLRYFHDVISALGEKRGPVLFQLPPNFKKDTLVLGDFLNGLPGECARHSNSVMNRGLTMKSLKRYERAALRFASPTQKSWKRQRLSRLITAICGYGAKITRRATSSAGPSLFVNKNQTGAKLLFISNTKKRA